MTGRAQVITGKRLGGARPGSAGLSALLAAALVLYVGSDPALAYVGPGAGFAVATTIGTLFIAFFSALGALLFWPFRWVIRTWRRRRAHARARVRRFVVLGLDGLEPTLVERFMAEGKLPNLQRLGEQGCFKRLGTTAPPLSPVAWSSFLTCSNPGKHNIFDFLSRDVRTYLPSLSSVRINPPRRVLKLGRYRIPVGRPEIRLLRRGKPFWNVLGEHGIFSNVIRVPITFPPEPFRGVLLSAMCVPDLRGSQGTFSYYYETDGARHGPTPMAPAVLSESDRAIRAGVAADLPYVAAGETIGGEQLAVTRAGDVVRSHLVGPENTFVEGGGTLRCPFELRITGTDTATLKVNGETLTLRRGEYTPWVRVSFKAAPGIKVHGICEFLLLETRPLKLYVTPIQIDPASPALPISHPGVYATYLAKQLGTYATLGLAEDTWGLNARILDDEAFLHQCEEADAEREAMFFDALEKVRHGLVACVVDGPDRIQHMFWRYIDPEHPARAGQGGREVRDAIERMYVRMDALVGRTLAACDDPHTVLVVMSDHGFGPFRRGVDLNRWLEQNGYLVLKPDGRGKKYLAGVDWSRTRAYALGLAGIWINQKGREAQGIVEPGDAAALRAEIAGKLAGLRDDATGEVAIHRVFDAHTTYRGPYKDQGHDLVVGYSRGYRVCWETALGEPTERVFHDNTKAWSGDHCVDPALVPGVLFCNRKIATERPHLIDVGATALDLFGVPVPEHMDGRPLVVAEADGTFPGEPDVTTRGGEKVETEELAGAGRLAAHGSAGASPSRR